MGAATRNKSEQMSMTMAIGQRTSRARLSGCLATCQRRQSTRVVMADAKKARPPMNNTASRASPRSGEKTTSPAVPRRP